MPWVALGQEKQKEDGPPGQEGKVLFAQCRVNRGTFITDLQQCFLWMLRGWESCRISRLWASLPAADICLHNSFAWLLIICIWKSEDLGLDVTLLLSKGIKPIL